mgnify:CR=1 FL=1
MIRYSPVFGETRLNRVDGGLQVTTGNEKLQVQAGLVDAGMEDEDTWPRHIRDGVLRIQTEQRGALIGFNAIRRVTRDDPDHSVAYGVDWRWARPNLIIRGEAVRAYGLDAPQQGFYCDAFYRPVGSTSTRFVARLEGYGPAGKKLEKTVATIGIRQVLSPNFTVSANYATGTNGGAAKRVIGWSLQLMTLIYLS